MQHIFFDILYLLIFIILKYNFENRTIERNNIFHGNEVLVIYFKNRKHSDIVHNNEIIYSKNLIYYLAIEYSNIP